METKICSKCGIEKPITEFIKRPNTNNYYGTCRECKNEYARIYRIEKAVQISKQRKQHYRDNIDLMHERGKKYYEEHKEDNQRRNREYYKRNAKTLNKKSRQYYKEHKEEIRIQKKEYNASHNDQRREWQEKYYEDNKENIYNYQKEYREKNSDSIKEYMRQYRLDNKEILKKKQKEYNNTHREKIRERDKKYRENNINKIRIYHEKYRKERVSSDPLFKLTVNIRHLISNSLRRQGYTKKTRTYKILGCDYDEFNNYLLKTFKNNYGYNWDGIEDVHIDHIIPLSTAKSEEEIIKLCHYSNLQLLKAKDNLDKKDKLDWSINNEHRNL